DDPGDLVGLEAAPVSFRGDDLDGVERFVPHGSLLGAAARSSAPNESGSTSLIGRMPETVSTSRSAPPCSHSSCRQRPHGMMTSPAPLQHVKATRRPPPPVMSAEMREHSAQR